MHDHIGLARGTVRLESYNSDWPKLFAAEAKLLKETLDIAADSIQHVGSTSISGMVAKPIIDITIRVDSLSKAEEWQKPLKDIGYWYKGIQPDMPDRRFFAKGPEAKRTVYLHLVNDDEFKRLITFKNALIHNKQAAKEYARLKLKLAASNANDRANYTKLKNDFIQSTIKQHSN